MEDDQLPIELGAANGAPASLLQSVINSTTSHHRILTTDEHSISNYSLHPGYTTLISFGISLLLVALYLYAYDIKECLCCLTCYACRSKRTYDEESLEPGTNESVNDKNQPPSSSGNLGINNERRLSLWNTELSCDCGEIHKARHCIRTSHFENDFDTFMKSVSTLSESSSPTISPAPMLSAPRGSLPLARGSSLPTFPSKTNSFSYSPRGYPTLHPVPENAPSSSREDQVAKYHPRHFKRSLSTVA